MEDCVLDMLILLPLKNTTDIKTIWCGHFSGRLTACIVAAGSICRQILKSQGIVIGSHIESLYTLSDIPFSQDSRVLENKFKKSI